MPRSATIWAAALVMASLSGSGPMLTTAEAMPAPGPQQTPDKPRYYFPRHVKREVVNTTAPASTTLSESSSSSEPSDAPSRQSRRESSLESSILESFGFTHDGTSFDTSASSSLSSSSSPSSSLVSSISSSASTETSLIGTAASTVIVVSSIAVSPSPEPSSSATTTYVTPQAPIPSDRIPSFGGETGVSVVTSIAALSSTIASVIASVSSLALSAGVASSSLVLPTSAQSTLLDTSPASSTGGLPSSIVLPTTSAQSAAIETLSIAPLESIIGVSTPVLSGIFPGTSSAVGSSGGSPTSTQVTTAVGSSDASTLVSVPAASAIIPSTILSGTAPGSIGGISSLIVQPTSSATDNSPLVSFLSNIPLSDPPNTASTGGIPVSLASRSIPDAVSSIAGLLSSIVSGASTGGLPTSLVPALESSVPTTTIASAATTVASGSSTLGPFIVSLSSATDGSQGTTVNNPVASTGAGIPTILPSNPLESVLSSVVVLPTATSDLNGIIPSGSSGVIPAVTVLPTSGVSLPSDGISASLPTTGTGIIVGITTALGTDPLASPTASVSALIPTSETISPTDVPLVSSLLSDVSSLAGVIPTSGVVLTDPTAGPTAVTSAPSGITPDPIVPSLVSQISSAVSVIESDVSSLVSSVASIVPTSVPDIPSIVSSIASSVASEIQSEVSAVLPTGTLPVSSVPIASIVSSIEASLSTVIPSILPGTTSDIIPTSLPILSSDILTIPSGTGFPSTGLVPTPISETPTFITPSETLVSITPIPSSGLPLSTLPSLTSDFPTSSAGVTPPPVSSGISSGTAGTAPTIGVSSPLPSSSGIPTSEVPPSSSPISDASPSASSPNASDVTPSASETPVSTPEITPTPVSSSDSSLAIPIPLPTSSKQGVPTIIPTATNSATGIVVGTSIVAETTQSSPTPVSTGAGIPSDMPKMIAPQGGIPVQPADTFNGKIGFKWPLNYPYVASHDQGLQINTYLPIAIADALNIPLSNVTMAGLKPLDTTQYEGFITTLALFYIPKDLNQTLQNQIWTPTEKFHNNKNETVAQLVSLINTAIPIDGLYTPEGSSTTPASNPQGTATGAAQGGGAMGGDIGASRRVNPTSAGIATGAVMGAVAYGAAMFFVARRYRNKRMAHRRSSSVPSTNRYTYGSMQGGAWMSGGRGPGRLTPSGRDSRGSGGTSSSNGRSVRTQQISAPVMAENSLGWN